MANLNQVNLIGHVTRDPELRYTPKGTAVCALGLAVNRSWKDNSGTEKKVVTFIDVMLWARLGEIAAEYLRQGHPVFITGRLHQEKWLDKQTNQNRSKLTVVAEGMQLLKQKTDHTIARQTTPARATATNNDTPQYPDQGNHGPATDQDIRDVFPNATPALLPTAPEDEIPF